MRKKHKAMIAATALLAIAVSWTMQGVKSYTVTTEQDNGWYIAKGSSEYNFVFQKSDVINGKQVKVGSKVYAYFLPNEEHQLLAALVN